MFKEDTMICFGKRRTQVLKSIKLKAVVYVVLIENSGTKLINSDCVCKIEKCLPLRVDPNSMFEISIQDLLYPYQFVGQVGNPRAF